jgi:hypothetical protein
MRFCDPSWRIQRIKAACNPLPEQGIAEKSGENRCGGVL